MPWGVPPHHAADVRCVVCDTPLAPPRARHSQLCMSAVCAGRYAQLRAHEKCAECARPLTWSQQASRVCDHPRCRQARLLERPMAAAREAYQRLQDVAAAARDQALAAHGVPQEEWTSWPVAVVPKFRARASRLPKSKRAAFAAHLEAQVRGARARFDAGERLAPHELTESAPAPSARAAEVNALLGATCGACRGACCRGGGANHAYLREHAMLAYMQRFPDTSDDDIVEEYLSHVPERTLSGGCVYQRADGCTLPRDLRADICNRYFCPGLLSIRDGFGDEAPIRAYVAHQEGPELTGGRFLPVLPG